MDSLALYTKIKNVSGGRLTMRPYLPPGKYNLAAAEEVLIPFHAFGGQNHKGQMRSNVQAALEDDLENGRIEILHGPAPILQDRTNDEARELRVDNGALVIAGASWSEDSDSEF